MGRVSAAFRIFFRTLSDADTAARVSDLLEGKPLPAPPVAAPTAPPAPPKPVAPPPPIQSPAITLLSALQREARLVDFLKEDLSGYADEQIGAAVREIHRDAGQTLDRLFAIRPVVADEEGAAVEVPVGFDAGQYRLTGQVTGSPPYRGTLQHHGWQATKCELPTFTGGPAAANTLAPAEVQLG
jgi:hypothetical protein